MNDYDSQRLVELLRVKAGYQATQDPEQADLLLLNTCSIREKAQEKLFHQLGQWKKLKLRRPSLRIAVGGCVAVQEGEAILKRAPYVDILFGPQTLHQLPELLRQFERDRTPVVAVEGDGEVESKFDALPLPQASPVVASITIMEGCDKFCTYCVVPWTRGAEVCRSLEAIYAEACHHLRQGAREILLLGQNVNGWKGQTSEGHALSFADLLHRLASLPGLARLRFLTSHPLDWSEALTQAFARSPTLPSFLHLPLQSGSNRILKSMARGYTVEAYAEMVRQLKAVRPDLVLSSDFIVGFPGEEESDFEATLDWAERLDFDISYSFIYSPRPRTPAADLQDPTPYEVKRTRLHALQRRLSHNVLSHSKAWLGRQVEVLVEKSEGEHEVVGRTPQNRWVRCLAPSIAVGTLLNARLVGIEGSFFRGEFLGVSEHAAE